MSIDVVAVGTITAPVSPYHRRGWRPHKEGNDLKEKQGEDDQRGYGSDRGDANGIRWSPKEVQGLGSWDMWSSNGGSEVDVEKLFQYFIVKEVGWRGIVRDLSHV